MQRIVVLALAVVLAAGCGTRTSTPESRAAEPPEEVPIADSSLQENASTTAPESVPDDPEAPLPASADDASGGATHEPDAAAPSPPPEAPQSSQAASDERSFRRVGHISDRVGDAGLEAPDYADITAVTIEDDGQRARMTVEVAGTIPRQLADGEVLGVGIDLFTNARGESEYQLFAVGNVEGWETFLQNANGLFEHPGGFRVEASRVEFEIEWTFLGSLPRGSFSSFVDWSLRRPVVNAVGGDRAPDSRTAPFQR